MPYNISPMISLKTKGEWFEGEAYTKENLYSIAERKMPPVNYDRHVLGPHSMAHIETPLHTQKDGKSIDLYYRDLKYFYGKTKVVKFKNNNWNELQNGLKQKIISLEELKNKLSDNQDIEKLLISIENIELNEFGYHNPNFILTLSLEAAQYLSSLPNFNLFGTSWKSSDFQPGSSERPIHNEIFKKALILEYINLNNVPEGDYFLSAFPLNLQGASETPVTAILFNYEELKN